MRERLASILDRLHRSTNDDRYSRAAATLRGGHAGRPAIDDSEPLEFARAVIAAGVAKSHREASIRASRFYAGSTGEMQQMVERLRKKLQKGKEM